MAIGICRLCLQERELINVSHIISDFMFKPLYDEKHTLRLADPDKYIHEGELAKTPKSSPYNGGILCANCDNVVLSRYEDYAAKVLYPKGLLSDKIWPYKENFLSPDGQEWSVFTNIDYKKMKLFLLSLLWRASISDHPTFEEIKLKPEDEEKIRHMLHNDLPLRESDYPIFIFSWLNDPQSKSDFVSKPLPTDRGELSWYVFPIRGIIYNFYLSIDSVPMDLRPYILREDGSMSIFYMPIGTWAHWLGKYHNVR